MHFFKPFFLHFFLNFFWNPFFGTLLSTFFGDFFSISLLVFFGNLFWHSFGYFFMGMNFHCHHFEYLKMLQDPFVHFFWASFQFFFFTLLFSTLLKMPNAFIKHCQRHNGPEGWVLLTKVTSLGHITSSYTNLDQTSSESWPRTNFKILTKPWNLVLKVWTKT